MDTKRVLGRAVSVAIGVGALAIGACDDGAGTGTGGAATGGTGGAGGAVVQTNYVLVHGAFMGAWGWDKVRDGLAAHGGKVTVVELPSHGADMTPPKEATMDGYVAKVGAAIDGLDGKVVLVGHSMGGIVISGVAEQKPDRIERLVYVAALLPKDGDSLQSLGEKDTASHLGPVVELAPPVVKIPTDKLVDIFCAECAGPDAQSILDHYRDEPLTPLITPIHLTPEKFGTVSKHYVYTKQDNAVTYAAQQTMTAGITLAATVTLDAGHSPFLSQPDAVVTAIEAP